MKKKRKEMKKEKEKKNKTFFLPDEIFGFAAATFPEFAANFFKYNSACSHTSYNVLELTTSVMDDHSVPVFPVPYVSSASTKRRCSSSVNGDNGNFNGGCCVAMREEKREKEYTNRLFETIARVTQNCVHK